jgi:hypothetical protein
MEEKRDHQKEGRKMHSQPEHCRKTRLAFPPPGRAAVWNWTVSLLIAVLALGGDPVHALKIRLIDVGSTPMTATQLAALQTAATIWEIRITDPIRVDLNYGLETGAVICAGDPSPSCPTSVIAATRSNRTSPSWSQVRNVMWFKTSINSPERNAVNQLPLGAIPLVDINGTRYADNITLTTANAKALFLPLTLDNAYGKLNADGQILFNTYFLSDFDFDRSNGIDPGKKDFVATAVHEIGHALGFVSLTDVQDANPLADGNMHNGKPYPKLYPSTLDLWRFADDMVGGVNSHPLGTEARQLTANAAEYYDSGYGFFFSWGDMIDPHCNAVFYKCQASHTRDDLGDLMDPTLADGIWVDVQPDDLHALDYVGYDVVQIRLDVAVQMSRNRWLFFDPASSDPPPPIPDEQNNFPVLPSIPNPDPHWNTGASGYVDFGVNPNTGIANNGGKRSMVLMATFQGPTANSVPPISGVYSEGQSEWLDPTPLPVTTNPPKLCNLYVVTDDQYPQLSGRPFGGPESCSDYDPNLGGQGGNGGWRIPLCMDGGDPTNCAAIWVFNLQLEAETPADGMTWEWLTQTDEGATIVPTDEDNVVIDYDPSRTGNLDSDGDMRDDNSDNCLFVFNPDQRDTDGDGYGNRCDGDLNNDGATNTIDLNQFKLTYRLAYGEEGFNDNADFNGDKVINTLDLNIFKGLYRKPPGPSCCGSP